MSNTPEGDYFSAHGGSVQQAGAAFVELLATGVAAEPAVTLDGCARAAPRRLTSRTPHTASNQLPPRDDTTADQSRPTRLALTLTEPRPVLWLARPMRVVVIASELP